MKQFKKIPFGEINAAALAQLPGLIEQWLPDGKWRGREYQARNPTRTDASIGSFSVNTVTGRWADFATDDAGGDAVSLYAFIHGLRQGEAARELAAQFGIEVGEHPRGLRTKRFAAGGMGRQLASSSEEVEQSASPTLTVVSGSSLPARFQTTSTDRKDIEPVSEPEAGDVGSIQAHEPPVVAPSKQEPEERGTRQKAAELWKASEETNHPLLAHYLRSRGLEALSAGGIKDVRLHQELEYWNQGEEGPVSLGKFPAMLAVVRDVNGRGVGLHRTYLQHDGAGKLNLSDPENPWDEAPLPAKKLLAFEAGVTRGAAIRLGQGSNPGIPGTLHVAEGIETALAVMLVKGGNVWATVSANGMAALEAPTWATEVVVWADKDRSEAGENAADALADRLRRAGTHTEIRLPSGPVPDGKKGIDWLDVLNHFGEMPFRKRGWLS